MRDLIYLTCILALSAVLMHLSNIAISYVNAATQVYCEQRVDFSKCSQEFKEKTSKIMKEKN